MVFKKLARLVLRARISPERAIIDHLPHDLVSEARNLGFTAGVTVQAVKMTASDAVSIVSRLGAFGIVINSDFSNAPSYPLTLPKVAQEMAAGGISKEEVERATYTNIKNFLKF